LIEESIKLKKKILAMITKAKSGHPGGSLSSTEILISLYKKILNHNPQNPLDPNRDRFILSKGHCAPALYAILSAEGYFPEEWLDNLRKFKSPLQGHPKKDLVPGVEISTGSLGMGLAAGVGMAMAARIDKNPSTTYILLGDGECNEGSIWESAMAAAHYNLDQLIVIVDRNGIQLDGTTEKIMSIEPLCAKWESFGWNVIEIDGTSIRELIMALSTAKELKGKPVVIIAYMIKGQGVSFMQHMKEFHGKPPSMAELEKANKDLEQYCKLLIEKAKSGSGSK
jgi:transketolase